MNIEELEKWIATKSGTDWLNEKKAGLLSKNNELINSLKTANGSIADYELRLAAVTKEADQERGALKQALLVTPLEKLLEEKNVFKILLPHITKELCEVYDLTIKADGDNRQAVGTIDGQELPLADIVETWVKSENAKEFIQQPIVGFTMPQVKGGIVDEIQTLKGKTGRELARMTDKEFEQVLSKGVA